MRRFLAALLLVIAGPAWAQGLSNPGMFPTGTVTPNDFVTYKDASGFPTLDSGVGIVSGRITPTSDPVNPLDTANKRYVDSVAAGLVLHAGARGATTANLSATYSNGSSGVGATLTNSGTNAAFATDGVTASINDRWLVKDQTTTFQNGIYTVTTVGNGSTPWVLTRATDFDQVVPAEVAVGAFMTIASGTVNAGSAWIESGQGPFTIGTTPIVFTQFGQQSSINCAQLPALTGDATTSAGSCATIVGKVDAVTYPPSPAVNTVPVVTSATSGGVVTYEQVPNAALANTTITVNTVPCTLGSTCTITSGLSGLTSNVITKGTSSSTIGSSSITDNGTTISTSEVVNTGGIGLGTGAATQTYANNAVATVINKVAILGSGYSATLATTGNLTGALGICVSGCANTGSSVVAWGGTQSCVFDGATTQNDWVGMSGTVAGDCKDLGVAAPAAPPNGVAILGIVTSTNGAGGTYSVDMNVEGVNSAALGNTYTAGSGLTLTGTVFSLTSPVALSLGGTHANLSATGAAHNVLQQSSVGANITVGQLACADLSNSVASCSTDATNAANISSGTLAAGRLPNPTAITLGGVESITAVTHQFLTSISTSGVPTQAQPAASDITGLAATATSNALSSLATQAANTVVANVSGSSAAPTAAAIPSCVDGSGNHLNYTSGTGFSCGTTSSSNSPLTLISTQTASAAASIQFTSLPGTYNTLFLNCESLTTSGEALALFQVGEGAGPTWESGANYTVASMFAGSAGPGVGGGFTTTATDLTNPGGFSAGDASSVRMYIDNVGSSSVYKNVTYVSATSISSPPSEDWYTVSGSSRFNLDKNPITGIRVFPAAGTITGKCSLYGMS